MHDVKCEGPDQPPPIPRRYARTGPADHERPPPIPIFDLQQVVVLELAGQGDESTTAAAKCLLLPSSQPCEFRSFRKGPGLVEQQGDALVDHHRLE